MKRVYLIFRDEMHHIKKIETIEYNKNLFDDDDSLISYLEENDRKKCVSYSCSIDFNCRQNFFFNNYKKEGYVDLSYDFSNLKYSKYFSTTKDQSITINVRETIGGGIGGPQEFEFIIEALLKVYEIMKILFFFLAILLRKNRPFYYLEKEYGYSREFITGLVYHSSDWKKQFLELSDIKYKNIVESSLMKKLGFKLINNTWHIDVYLPNYYQNNSSMFK